MARSDFRYLFPAHAGLFPAAALYDHHEAAFPCTRGVVPWIDPRGKTWDLLFPAYTGLILPSCCPKSGGSSFPRIRGVVPLRDRSEDTLTYFPRIRGVIPSSAAVIPWPFAFPRMRGVVPYTGMHTTGFASFSPHTRGCSEYDWFVCSECFLFPTYAGLFLGAAVATPNVRVFPTYARSPSKSHPHS